MTEDFTIGGYETLLRALDERGYVSCRYQDVVPARRNVILRHDIDFSPSFALAQAEVEAAQGMCASYFFLTNTPFYEITSDEIRSVLRSLKALGHEVALHFDAALYPDDRDILDREVNRECAILEDLIAEPVEVISFHRPAKSLLNCPDSIAGRFHTYQPKFFTDIGYCSDSRGLWRYGPPLDHSAIQEGRAIQLLTHPIWWAHKTARTREAVLADFVRGRDASICEAIAETITGYDPKTGVITDPQKID
ncbi:MAG: hypothetical protein P1V34_09795 [Alphaproteobacteria bacterium]|nr:hypothetical protein [Alphaproteobacteria bacterium]